MEVSWNRGTPKSSILIVCSIINNPFGGITIYGNPHIVVFAYGWKTEPAFCMFLCLSWGLNGVGWANNVHLHCLTYMMLRYSTSSWTSSHTWCYDTLLRYFTSSCTASHTWCYATVRLLALPHIYDATLHFTSSWTSSHTWCYATVRLLARRKKEKAAEVFDMSSEKYARIF